VRWVPASASRRSIAATSEIGSGTGFPPADRSQGFPVYIDVRPAEGDGAARGAFGLGKIAQFAPDVGEIVERIGRRGVGPGDALERSRGGAGAARGKKGIADASGLHSGTREIPE
jgi:hypothetical protein